MQCAINLASDAEGTETARITTPQSGCGHRTMELQIAGCPQTLQPAHVIVSNPEQLSESLSSLKSELRVSVLILKDVWMLHRIVLDLDA